MIPRGRAKRIRKKSLNSAGSKKSGGFSFDGGAKLIIGAAAALWLASGFYQVQTNEQGVVLRFGKYVDTTEPGLHYHLPYPIETVEKVSMTQERSINLGVAESSRVSNVSRAFTESHMLTGDENIVDINLTVVWRIKNAKDYLFSMRSPDQTVSVARTVGFARNRRPVENDADHFGRPRQG